MDQFEQFRETVYRAFDQHGRDLPWRKTEDPYRILVSEIMLQQTQVSRVMQKYGTFLERFPDVKTLSEASLSEVMTAWQGLGYNRRALMMKNMAEEIVSRSGGEIPSDEHLLKTLPGIGPYTAAAVCVFAFNQPLALIETNVRSVFLHHYFPGQAGVRDKELLPLIRAALDRENPRRWYSALMDYGVFLKSTVENPGRKSAHHVHQSPFEGSDRQLRGRVLKALVEKGKCSQAAIIEVNPDERERILSILLKLEQEGLIVKEKRSYRIA